MFAPIANSPIPAHINLVATPLPNTLALRVPSTDVAPSPSSAQIDNNASANSGFISEKISVAPLPIPLQTSAGLSAQNYVLAQTNGGAVQAEFLAQLASGDASPEVDKIFAQYEKLVKYGTVKYKPSDAGKPENPEIKVVQSEPKLAPQAPYKEVADVAKVNAYKEAVARNADI
jgi:hypothetical protein